MATPIKLKRSAVEGKRPGLSDLQLGELALNTNDGNIFVERDTGGVGIATTIANVTPWTENYGGESIYYNDNVGIGTTGNDIDSIGRALNIASSGGGAIYLQDTDSPTTKFGVISYDGNTAAGETITFPGC